MHLRSGYVTPSDVGDWDFDPSDYESESDTHGKRNQQQREQQDTIICAPTTVRNAGRPQTQSQAPASTDIPSWVPARLPSCVPGPRHDLPSGTEDVKSDTMIVKSNQNWPIIGSGFLQSAQMPGRLPVLGGRLGAMGDFNPMGIQNTFTGTHPFFPPIFGDGFQLNNKGFGDAFPISGTMGMANSLLPLMPLGAGRNPFLDFGIQPSLPFAGPSVNMDLAMEPSPFPPPDNLPPTGNGDGTGNVNVHGTDSINANVNNIPLLCHLCPSRPKFSDVSHLLTHISSKSHLAALFKLGLSDQDVDKQTIRRFNDWAEQYGINQLLKNRQDAKEQKKQGQKKRQRALGNEAGLSRTRLVLLSRRNANALHQKKNRCSVAASEDVKVEPDDSLNLQVDHNPLNQNTWHLHTPRDASFDEAYQTPLHNRFRSVYPLPDSPQAANFLNSELIADGRDGKSNTPRLKGAVWPGMNIFDAATPDMQRMRNQKKHASVLQNMVLTSQSIEQDELIWDDKMVEITRTRNVYDSPSLDGSPESKEEEEEPPTKKRRGRRAAVVETSTQRQTRATTRASKTGGKHATGKKIPKVEVESDSEEIIKPQILRGRRGLDVFDDNGHDASLGGDVFGGHHRPVAQDFASSTLGGSPYGDQQNALPYRNAMQGLPTNRSMASMFGRADHQQSFGFYDKENDGSAFSAQHTEGIPTFYNQLRQNIQPGGLNPLCVQRQNHFPYLYGEGFDNNKPATPTSYPPMHGMNYPGLNNSLDTMSNQMTNGSQFQPGNGSGQNTNFDI